MGRNDTCKEEKVMTKEEFIEKVNERLTERGSQPLRTDELSGEDFSVINTVYMFHPAINNVSGKDQIADLYVYYGFSVIVDMLSRADEVKRLEEKIRDANASIDGFRKRLALVAEGLDLNPF